MLVPNLDASIIEPQIEEGFIAVQQVAFMGHWHCNYQLFVPQHPFCWSVPDGIACVYLSQEMSSGRHTSCWQFMVFPSMDHFG